MILDDAQRTQVAEWIKQGLKLSDIQTKLAELGLKLTYMDVRLLVDDLKLTPKDVDRPKPAASTLAAPTVPANPPTGPGAAKAPGPAAAPRAGNVSVSVDQLARAGAMVSGSVTFSDGNSAAWYIDQAGRLGLAPQQTGYRPPAADLQQFQTLLDSELSKMGF